MSRVYPSTLAMSNRRVVSLSRAHERTSDFAIFVPFAWRSARKAAWITGFEAQQCFDNGQRRHAVLAVADARYHGYPRYER